MESTRLGQDLSENEIRAGGNASNDEILLEQIGAFRSDVLAQLTVDIAGNPRVREGLRTLQALDRAMLLGNGEYEPEPTSITIFAPEIYETDSAEEAESDPALNDAAAASNRASSSDDDYDSIELPPGVVATTYQKKNKMVKSNSAPSSADGGQKTHYETIVSGGGGYTVAMGKVSVVNPQSEKMAEKPEDEKKQEGKKKPEYHPPTVEEEVYFEITAQPPYLKIGIKVKNTHHPVKKSGKDPDED